MIAVSFTGLVSTRGSKIETLLERKGENPAWLAKQLGVPKQSVYNWIDGTKPQNAEIWPKIAELLGIPLNVLLDDDAEVPSRHQELRRVSLSGTPLVAIPVVGLAAAGAGASNVDVQDDHIYVPERLSQIGGLGWIVDGESMMPVLEPGDVAIFREAHSPRRGLTYLLKNEDGEFRIKTMDWQDSQWVVKSLNPTFATEPLGQHQILGFLIGWYRTKGSRETMDSDPGGLVL